jgi:hypothetical protein
MEKDNATSTEQDAPEKVTRVIYQTGELKFFSDRLGHVYGTEDWSIFMYSLVKMHRPETIVELGTGIGATAFWMAQACRENSFGHVTTIDNGSHWTDVIKGSDNLFLDDEKFDDIDKFMEYMLTKHGLKEFVSFVNTSMPPYPIPEKPIDLLFSDFKHDPNSIMDILAQYLPRMSPVNSIFFDAASTSFSSFSYLELLIPLLNKGVVPDMLWQKIDIEQREKVKALVVNSVFELKHMTKQNKPPQNSTAWIQIYPNDTRPYPKAAFH